MYALRTYFLQSVNVNDKGIWLAMTQTWTLPVVAGGLVLSLPVARVPARQ